MAHDLTDFHPRDDLYPRSRWAWKPTFFRSPPSDAALRACGFDGCEWAPAKPRDAANLLLLFHGLGDAPAAFARFAASLALPQTSALAVRGPLPLPLDLPGRMWHDSFDADGEMLNDHRRSTSLARERHRLRRLLHLLSSGCGWSCERIFLFGYAQGGVAALDFLAHLEPGDGRLGGVVSWCGLPLPETPCIKPHTAAAATPLLVVAGGHAHATVTPGDARRLYEGYVGRQTTTTEEESEEQSEEQSLRLLPAHGGEAMVQSPTDVRLLMEFWARHLALSSALEDDPTIVRVS